MRARAPDRCGYAVRSGVRLYWEEYGAGTHTVLLLPTWAIVDSRAWKLQVPYLARHFRVIVFDPRGNGRSDRPQDPQAHADSELVEDAITVLDATDTETAVCVGLSLGARVLVQLAAAHPDRVRGAVFVGPTLRWNTKRPARGSSSFDQPGPTDAGWDTYCAPYWRRDLPGFARFFFGEAFCEPHSSKQVDDAVQWAADTDAETLIVIERAAYLGAGGPAEVTQAVRAIRCPSLVVYGDDDRIAGPATAEQLAAELGAPAVVFAGGGHCVPARHPVRFNLELRRFVESVHA
jgi:pimeloyl-ACP methyl ester carboxylesterase